MQAAAKETVGIIFKVEVAFDTMGDHTEEELETKVKKN